MLQNKIYQNYLIEIFKTFFVILFALSLIALTVRAVSFLELIVDSGYLLSTYFKFSILNILGLVPKFIPLSFLISLIIFVMKHKQDSEFVILWTSGVKKISVINLLVFSSFLVVIFHLTASALITPFSLNKARKIVNNNEVSSFLPTLRVKQFSDSFVGLTVFVEKKIGNELKNIFLHDQGGNLRGISSNISNPQSVTIIASDGIIDKNKIIFLNGQIITEKTQDQKNDILKFDQLNISLNNLNTRTIKKPKIQETSTINLINCLLGTDLNKDFCNESFKKEIIPNLNRRIVMPFYVPVITLICCLLLLKTEKKYLNKYIIFLYSFLILVFSELFVRYTGVSLGSRMIFLILPVTLFFSLYSFIFLKLANEK